MYNNHIDSPKVSPIFICRGLCLVILASIQINAPFTIDWNRVMQNMVARFDEQESRGFIAQSWHSFVALEKESPRSKKTALSIGFHGRRRVSPSHSLKSRFYQKKSYIISHCKTNSGWFSQIFYISMLAYFLLVGRLRKKYFGKSNFYPKILNFCRNELPPAKTYWMIVSAHKRGSKNT